MLERLETAQRRLIAVSHDHIARLEHVGAPPVPVALADVPRISRAEARRRVRDAEQLTPRTSRTGEVLPPLLLASAEARGRRPCSTSEHLRVIQKFIRDLPGHITPDEIANAERALAGHAENLRPDQLEKVADRLALTLNPDGRFSDEDRARKRGIRLVRWSTARRHEHRQAGRHARVAVHDRRLAGEVRGTGDVQPRR